MQIAEDFRCVGLVPRLHGNEASIRPEVTSKMHNLLYFEVGAVCSHAHTLTQTFQLFHVANMSIYTITFCMGQICL